MKLYYPTPPVPRRARSIHVTAIIDFQGDFRRNPVLNRITLIGDDGYSAGQAAYALNAHERCIMVLSDESTVLVSPRGVNAYLQRLGQLPIEELHNPVDEPEEDDYDDPE